MLEASTRLGQWAQEGLASFNRVGDFLVMGKGKDILSRKKS